MSDLTATRLYGADPTQLQPTAHPAPDHLGQPEPVMLTKDTGRAGQSPIVLLVVILALVVLLSQVSFRGTVQVRG